MNSLTRPSAAWLCIGAGIAPFLLFFYVLLQEKAIRHRMEEKLEKDRLTEIVIANPEVHWVKAGKEIRVNGRMFDVQAYTAGETQTRFRGLFDEEETTLKKILEQATEKNTAGRRQWLAQLLQNLQNLYSNVNPSPLLLQPFTAKPVLPGAAALLSGFRPVFSPPPRAGSLSFS